MECSRGKGKARGHAAARALLLSAITVAEKGMLFEVVSERRRPCARHIDSRVSKTHMTIV